MNSSSNAPCLVCPSPLSVTIDTAVGKLIAQAQDQRMAAETAMALALSKMDLRFGPHFESILGSPSSACLTHFHFGNALFLIAALGPDQIKFTDFRNHLTVPGNEIWIVPIEDAFEDWQTYVHLLGSRVRQRVVLLPLGLFIGQTPLTQGMFSAAAQAKWFEDLTKRYNTKWSCIFGSPKIRAA
jgi:hypothetical protein